MWDGGSNKNLILVEGSSPSPSFSFRACFMYGPHNREDRARVWRRIINQAISCSGPFLLIGDFNLIGGIIDKQGGSVNVSRIDEFQEFMYASELIEILFKSTAYTWDNKRNGGENVRERIDRALGNATLFEAFPYQSLTHLPLIGSDHSPLTYKTCSSPKKHRKSFKFKSMWTLEESCEEAIRESWCTSQQNDHMKNLKNQLASCAMGLCSWSRSHFGNNTKIIGALTAELTGLQWLPPTIENGSQQRVILLKLEETWLREEMF
ncbi:reverse transcriptase [Tanacetum coccineum]